MHDYMYIILTHDYIHNHPYNIIMYDYVYHLTDGTTSN